MCSIIMLVCGSAARDVGDYHLNDGDGGNVLGIFFFFFYYIITRLSIMIVFFFLATHLVEV